MNEPSTTMNEIIRVDKIPCNFYFKDWKGKI